MTKHLVRAAVAAAALAAVTAAATPAQAHPTCVDYRTYEICLPPVS